MGHDRGMSSGLIEYARTVPLNALTAHGFGPLAPPAPKPSASPGPEPMARLGSLRQTMDGAWAAVETAGVIGRRLLSVLAALGGSASHEQLEFQTAAAAPGVLAGALERLLAAELVVARPDGRVELAATIREHVPGATVSLADPNAITSDALALVCRAIGVTAPSRKHERIDAIARTFTDDRACQRIRGELSAGAIALLDRVVAEAGPGTAAPESVGLTSYVLRSAAAPRYAFQRAPDRPGSAALFELTSRGIVGVAEWEGGLWVWREAWPFVGRPFFSGWATEPEPKVVAVDGAGPRRPTVVAALDQAMRAWRAGPPAALKNADARIGKGDVRSTAKALGVDQGTIDLASRLAISMGLLLRNVVGRSGRGRNARAEEVWLGDPTMVAAWEALTPSRRWARLVAEWCSPALPCGQQLLVNRHLVLWELSQLAEGHGYADAAEFAAWFSERYASLGHPQAALECIGDLRALDVVTPGPVALTQLGRAVLEDPGSIESMAQSESVSVVVQGDLTVIAPPDLRQDLLVELDALAVLENDSGALTYRLDVARITRAVQAGQTPSGIVDFLAGVATAPLPDTVVRLVQDAAARAGSVRVIAAPTVVVVSDPVDLVTACGLKALQLVKVTDTVAVTDVAPAKVRAALERKGLAPEAIVGGGGRRARSSAEEAALAAERAAALRAVPAGPTQRFLEHRARALDERARSTVDVAARLDVRGPLTVTAATLDRLASAGGR